MTADGQAQEQKSTESSGGLRRMGGRDMPVAIGTGLVMATALIGSNFWTAWAFAIVVALFAMVGLVETSRTLGKVGFRLPVPVLLVSMAIMLLGAYLVGPAGQALGIAVLFVGTFLWLLADSDRVDVLRNASTTIFLGLWVSFLASYAILLRTQDDGAVITIAVIGGAVFTDIGGFLFGVKLGRHKVAPSVSPAKSWEGLIGGLALSAVIAALVLPNVGDFFAGKVLAAAALGATCGLAGFFGDLFESMIKRDLGIKDLGTIIPGHGGVLDRLDGVLLALPVGYYLLQLA